MTNAGYSDSQYTIMAHTYWSPVPSGAGNRYSRERLHPPDVGGCGMWNRDADYANNTDRPGVQQLGHATRPPRRGLTNIKVLDLQSSLNGRRLCENTVGLLEEKGVTSWTAAGAVDKTEWVNQLRVASTVFGPYQIQESVHANHWGQMAMRNCMRQAYNGGAPRGGNCVRAANGLNGLG